MNLEGHSSVHRSEGKSGRRGGEGRGCEVLARPIPRARGLASGGPLACERSCLAFGRYSASLFQSPPLKSGSAGLVSFAGCCLDVDT